MKMIQKNTSYFGCLKLFQMKQHSDATWNILTIEQFPYAFLRQFSRYEHYYEIFLAEILVSGYNSETFHCHKDSFYFLSYHVLIYFIITCSFSLNLKLPSPSHLPFTTAFSARFSGLFSLLGSTGFPLSLFSSTSSLS